MQFQLYAVQFKISSVFMPFHAVFVILFMRFLSRKNCITFYEIKINFMRFNPVQFHAIPKLCLWTCIPYIDMYISKIQFDSMRFDASQEPHRTTWWFYSVPFSFVVLCNYKMRIVFLMNVINFPTQYDKPQSGLTLMQYLYITIITN